MTFLVGAMFVKEKQRPNDSSASHAFSEGIATIIGGECCQSSIYVSYHGDWAFAQAYLHQMLT